MKILVVDDHAVVRAGTRLFLEELKETVEIDEAENGCTALQLIRENNYDVVLLDLTLPDISGFKVLESIKRDIPGLPVIIVSMHDEEQFALKSYSLGADGYVNKGSAYSDLVHAIEKVTGGGKYISEHLMDAVVAGLRNSNTTKNALPKIKPLSKREKQIALLLVSGVTNKEIAWQLSINVKTVSTHKTRILNKLSLKNMAQLYMYAHVFNNPNQGGNKDFFTSLVDML